ncbi:MAG: hypothetical protein AAB071_00105 [Bacteroidota bacterium]
MKWHTLTSLTNLVLFFVVGVFFTGCYTQLAMNTDRPQYRHKMKKEIKIQKEEKDDAEMADAFENDNKEYQETESESYSTFDEEYPEGTVINNYYVDDADWWPHQRVYSGYYSPSLSFYGYFSDPVYSWDYYCYTPIRQYSWRYWDWCYRPMFVAYNPWWYSPYYWDWGWYGGSGYGYSNNDNAGVKTSRNFGRTRDGAQGRRDESRTGSVQDIRGGGMTLDIEGGKIIGGSVRDGKSTKENSGRRGNGNIIGNGTRRDGYRNNGRGREPQRDIIKERTVKRPTNQENAADPEVNTTPRGTIQNQPQTPQSTPREERRPTRTEGRRPPQSDSPNNAPTPSVAPRTPSAQSPPPQNNGGNRTTETDNSSRRPPR